jgi:hypothetical protein
VILDCLGPVLDALNMSEDKDASKFLGHFDAMLLRPAFRMRQSSTTPDTAATEPAATPGSSAGPMPPGD